MSGVVGKLLATASKGNWLPWRVQRALAWFKANRRAVAAIYRHRTKPPKHRILISTAFFGGVGGVEKLLKTLVESMPDSMFYIVAREVRTVGFIPATPNYLVNWPLRDGAHFDLYVYFAGGGKPTYLGDRYHFRAKLIDHCGADIRDIENKFDWIAIQTGNAGKYSGQPPKWVFAFPNLRFSFPSGRRPVRLPDRYFVTVFNPYSGKLKGNDAVYLAADAAAVPIVWCFSDKSGLKFDGLADHPNVIKLKNLSQEELYYVYEHALAYISFSHSEGLGWSIAEAFYLGLPIIAREVGFLTYVSDQPGIHLYRTEEELCALVSRESFGQPNYNYELLDDSSFEKVIDKIIG